jgi:hypothetical protein
VVRSSKLGLASFVASLVPVVALSALPACSRFGPVYPPRPVPADAPAVADPPPSKVVVHLAVTSAGLRSALEENVPRRGDGAVNLLGGDQRYTWERGPLTLGFAQGRVEIRTRVQATLALPFRTLQFPLDVEVRSEPVVSGEYVVRMQAIEVKVTSPDKGLAFADQIGGVYGRIEQPIKQKLEDFHQDLRPLLGEAYARVGTPVPIPLGEGTDATACANLKVLDVEAAPTQLADGIEKDIALVIAPSILLPCPAVNVSDTASLPALSNVASLAPGPFTVTVPVAARYEELTRAMSLAFTDGKLFFSKDFPSVYLEKPELYESNGALVLKLHIAGPVHQLGIDTDLDGDLFLTGHPQVVDNELTVPDLEPTIETRNFLLSLKAMADGDRIREQARAALRLDIGARINEAKTKLGDSLTFGDREGCFRGEVDRFEVTGVYPHAGYLRVYVAVTGRARAEVPCGK